MAASFSQSTVPASGVRFPCLRFPWFCNSTRSLLLASVPSPLVNPPTIDAYDTYAIISWVSPPFATLFNTYLDQAGLQIAINNGQGLLLTIPTITAEDVSSLVFCFHKVTFSSLFHVACSLENLHRVCVLWERGNFRERGI